MTAKTPLGGRLSLIVGAVVAAGNAAAEQPAGKPNVLLIVADDLGYGDVGCYGAELIKTPRIDRLATQGVRFLDAHSASSVCQPSRYAILSGRYDWRRGKPWDGQLVFTPGEPTLASVLKGAGYNTACIGKWHLGFDYHPVDYNKELKPGPLEVGFDEFFGTPRTDNEPPFVFVKNHYVVGLDPKDPIRIIPSKEAKKEGLPDWGWGSSIGAKAAHAARPLDQIDTIYRGKAIAYIQRQSADKPFFLYLPLQAPHVPNAPSKAFLGSSKAGKYGDVIQELDWCVGGVLDALKAKGMADNTLVIFTSDNGGVYIGDALEAGHHCNGSLLGQKTDAWDGGNQIPFIARWPGKVPVGKTSGAFISLTDIMATVAAATGVELPRDAGQDSLNQLPVFLNPDRAKAVRTQMVYTGIFGQGLRSGDWVYYPFQSSGGMTANPAQKWGQPYVKMGMTNSDLNPDGSLKADAPPAQLYNVALDPNQTSNLFREQPERADMMNKKLDGIVFGDRTGGNGATLPIGSGAPVKTPVGWNQPVWGKPAARPLSKNHYISDKQEVWLLALGKNGPFAGASLTLRNNASVWFTGGGALGQGVLVLDGGQLQNRFGGKAVVLGRIRVDSESKILNISGNLELRTQLSGGGDLVIGAFRESGRSVIFNGRGNEYHGTFVLADAGADDVTLNVEFKKRYPLAGLAFRTANPSRMPLLILRGDMRFQTVSLPSETGSPVKLSPGNYDAAALESAGVWPGCLKDLGGSLTVGL